MAYTFAQLEQLWVNAGGPAWAAPIMAAIGAAESTWGTNLHGDYGYTSDGGPTSFGIWQIHTRDASGYVNTNGGTPYDESLLVSDPNYNARAAVNVWRSQGFGAWSTYNSGAWKQFMQGSEVSAVASDTAASGTKTTDLPTTTFVPRALAPGAIALLLVFVGGALLLFMAHGKGSEGVTE